MNDIICKETHGQIIVDKFPCVQRKISLSALSTDKTKPVSLSSISTCCPAAAHSWKRKSPVFHPTSWVFLLLLPFRLSSTPPPYLVVTIRSLYHLHPVWTPPSTHSIPLCCPPSFPVTPPQLLGYYELYYFDPSPSICFNWIMICNHVLSGESIKRARASAPLLRGLLLFPNPPPPTAHTYTHIHTLDPGTSPFSFQTPTKYPRTWAGIVGEGGSFTLQTHVFVYLFLFVINESYILCDTMLW